MPSFCAQFCYYHAPNQSYSGISGLYAMSESIYKVIFYNQNQVFEVFVSQIFQSDLYGFIEVEEYLFGEKAQLIVDPGEEKLKSEFAGVSRSYIPIQSIIRIDEVDRQGTAKVSDSNGTSNVSHFPLGSNLNPGGSKE